MAKLSVFQCERYSTGFKVKYDKSAATRQRIDRCPQRMSLFWQGLSELSQKTINKQEELK